MTQVTISIRTALVLLVLALLAIPATATATHLFADVGDGHPHEEGIQFALDSGVSIGCGDGTVFCPDDPVTRAQMATFLNRFAMNLVPRVASDLTVEQTVVDGETTVLATSMEAPLDGFLSIVATLDLVLMGSPPSTVFCYVEVDGVRPLSGRRILRLDPGSFSENDCATSTVIPVPAGGHDVSIVLDSEIGGELEVSGSALTVTWIPHDGQGNPPSDFGFDVAP